MDGAKANIQVKGITIRPITKFHCTRNDVGMENTFCFGYEKYESNRITAQWECSHCHNGLCQNKEVIETFLYNQSQGVVFYG